jgi:hypothetical protein
MPINFDSTTTTDSSALSGQTYTWAPSGASSWYTYEPNLFVNLSERSEWHCELFGTGQSLVLHPAKGKVPNWFHRKMQYLILGNRWYKNKKHDSN